MTNDYRWNLSYDDIIIHYGVPHDKSKVGRGSGRYPWGSGAKNGKHKHEFKDNSASYKPEKSYLQKRILYETLGTTIGTAGAVGLFASGYASAAPTTAASATALAVSSAYNLSKDVGKYVNRSIQDSKATKEEKKLQEERKDNPIDKRTGFHLKTKEMTAEEDLSRVNPAFKNWDMNTKNNCVLCAVAFELRRRGYDVQANKAYQGYDDISLMPDYFKGAKYTFIDGGLSDDEIFANDGVIPKNRQAKMIDNAIDNIKNQPNGARGELSIVWDGTYSGHALSYSNEKGKIVIYDAQSNEMIKDIESIGKLFGKASQVQICRLDNLELNTKYIKEVAN